MNIFAPLNFRALEKRRENLSVAEANARQTEMLLRAELEHQYEQMNSTDPAVRERALDEIDRLNVLLRAT